MLLKREKTHPSGLFSEQPTNSIIMVHNGKGLESDFLFIKDFLAPFGENVLTFVTGAPYCYVEFGEIAAAERLTGEF